MELCGIAGVLQPVKTRHLYDDQMQRSRAGNSFHPAVIRGILDISHELHLSEVSQSELAVEQWGEESEVESEREAGVDSSPSMGASGDAVNAVDDREDRGEPVALTAWLSQDVPDAWSPLAPSQVVAAWPDLLCVVRAAIPSEASRLPACPYGANMPADVLGAPAVLPPTLSEPIMTLPPGLQLADRQACVQAYLTGVQELLGHAAQQLNIGRHYSFLDACRYITLHSVSLTGLPKYLLGDLSCWFPHQFGGSVRCPDLVRLLEFWAVHAAGQATSGGGPHGPSAATVLVFMEGPDGQILRFGSINPTSVDLLRFRPGWDTVDIGRIGCHLVRLS